MKKLVIIALTMFIGASSVCAQSQKEIARERREIARFSKSELNAKAGKAARKAAKAYAKEGWVTAPGQLPLDKQLDKAFKMQYEYDESAFPKFVMGEAMSTGENYDAARMQALELAKLNMAGQVQTEVTALIESSVSNRQLTADQAASITETITASKNLISQRIGRILPIVECYRILPNKNKEVRVQIAYDSKTALEAARSAVREQLEKKGEKLHEQLDKVLGF